MQLRVGARLKSAVDDTEVMVVRAPDSDVTITCGGHELIAHEDPPMQRNSVLPNHDAGTQLGKRYTDQDGTVELLCTKAGERSLRLGEKPMEVKTAKSLPASD